MTEWEAASAWLMVDRVFGHSSHTEADDIAHAEAMHILALFIEGDND